MSNSCRYPQETIDAVLAEKAKHRGSYAVWSAYINGQKSGPAMDILVHATETTDGHLLHQWWMAPVSDDIHEALSTALAGHRVSSITFEEDGDGPTEVTLYTGEWSGSGTAPHDIDDDDNYRYTERPGQFDLYSSIRARAVCLALLDMYSPTLEEEELADGERAE